MDEEKNNHEAIVGWTLNNAKVLTFPLSQSDGLSTHEATLVENSVDGKCTGVGNENEARTFTPFIKSELGTLLHSDTINTVDEKPEIPHPFSETVSTDRKRRRPAGLPQKTAKRTNGNKTPPPSTTVTLHPYLASFHLKSGAKIVLWWDKFKEVWTDNVNFYLRPPAVRDYSADVEITARKSGLKVVVRLAPGGEYWYGKDPQGNELFMAKSRVFDILYGKSADADLVVVKAAQKTRSRNLV
ncbi:hypothetical protein NQ176_g3928 [Zarea fungicola]|uniref:Uncharacterized protein n=1 Tax=Zarea fungicola TaxID=93591 RepID=A0ACC1NG13_9HYPO|nr:hypothetical protein NQ176_g3928 [Lecanicillium fungicola]